MDKEYVYKDGKALIIDENDNQRVIDYYDNLEEVLSIEYLIDEMKKNEKELFKDIVKLEKKKKFSKFTNVIRIMYFLIVIFLFFSILSPSIGSLKAVGEVEKVMFAFLLSFCTVPGVALSFATYIQEKIDLNDYNGKKMQLDNLKKEILKQERKLEKLKCDKTNSKKTGEFYLKKIEDREQDNYLDNFLSFFYNFGCYEEKYFKYYKNGKLDKILNVDSEEWKENVNEHLKEKSNGLKRVRKLGKINRK